MFRKMTAVSLTALMLLGCSGCGLLDRFLPEQRSEAEGPAAADPETEALRQQLDESTAYAKEHLPGVWSLPGGGILEFYPDQTAVAYAPVQVKDMDAEEIARSESDSIVYYQYLLSDPQSWTEEELRREAGQTVSGALHSILPRLQSIRPGTGEASDEGQVAFLDEDTLQLAGETLTRLTDGAPERTESAAGLYLHETDETCTLSVIALNEEYGYFNWVKNGSGTSGLCKLSQDRIVLSLPDGGEFVFSRSGTDLVEAGSQEVAGSQASYRKISDLSHTTRLDLDAVPAGMAGDDYYILPFSSDRLLTYDDIRSLSREELILARNELYAKHGRIFKVDWIREYFEAQPWYHGTLTEEEFSSSLFSDIEWQNIMFIKDYETMLDNQ